MFLKNEHDNRIDLTDSDLVISIDSEGFRWRIITIYIVLALFFVFIFISAFQLQIIDGSKSLVVASRTNNEQSKTLATRGLIFDAHGNKLAQNAPAYSLFIKPAELKSENETVTINKLAGLIGSDPDALLNTYKSKAYDDKGQLIKQDRVTLSSNLSFDQYFAVLSKQEELTGVYVDVEAVRQYTNGAIFSNIIGYTGDPLQSDLNKGIYSESQVGKTGVEKTYDSYLRGSEGLSVQEKEALTGNVTNSQVQEAVPGDNIYLTIDSAWQTKLTQIMIDNIARVHAFAGAAVIINSKTGGVKAMVSVPSYDNNLFAQGISAKDYNALISNPKRPMTNRPISLQLPPGSIMKIFGATAALESGTIDENTKKLSDRCMDLPGGIKLCEADRGYIGWVNVEQAMAASSNIFFCKVMIDMHDKPGYTYYYDIAKSYGIGSLTGIDLPGEGPGTLPSAELKKKIDNLPWYVGDECNTVIGQGYVTVTPMQMAVAISAIVNGGNVVKPYVLDHVEDQQGNIVFQNKPEYVRNINISTHTLDILKAGLRLGVTAGTAGALSGIPGNSIGKTGSSDAGEWIDGKYYQGAHSWVLGCFDFQGEQYCYNVMQQWGGRGYKTVPIMKKFINCIYHDFSNKCDAV